MSAAMPYCKPIDSSPAGMREVCRRLSALLHCLQININTAVAVGKINSDLLQLNKTLLSQLEGEGWSFSYDGGQKLKTRPPGHPHPFPKRNPKGTLTTTPKQ